MGRVSGGGAGGWTGRVSRRAALIERLRLAAAAAMNNNAEDLGIASSPPAVTMAATPTAALTRAYPFAANAGLFRVSGGIPVENNTRAGFFIFPVTKIGNGTTPGGNLGSWTGDPEDQQLCWSVTFQTDADAVEFKLAKNTSAGRPYRFIVDGQYLDKVGTDPQPLSGTTAYIKLDFSAQSPARKLRTITLEGSGSNQHMFAQVAVAPTASIAHPGVGRTDILALFGGDSFTEGQGTSNLGLAWPYRACRRLGIPRLYDLAIGTTGYVNTGSGNRRKLVDQVLHDWSRPAFAAADMVVIANGYNDKAAAATTPAILATIKAQALASWQAIRAQFPGALIVVCGVFGGRGGPNPDTIVTENGLKAQFDAWADPFALWIPVSTDPSPWQFGTGYTTAPVGDGNSDLTTGPDGTHPSDYGQDVIAARFAHALRTGLSKLTA